MGVSPDSICLVAGLVEPVLAHGALGHGETIIVCPVTSAILSDKVMSITLLVADVEIVLIWLDNALIPGSCVAAIAAEAALRVELEDGVEMVCVTGRATTLAEAGKLAVGGLGAFGAGVEILADVALVVRARQYAPLDLAHRCAATRFGHDAEGGPRAIRDERSLRDEGEGTGIRGSGSGSWTVVDEGLEVFASHFGDGGKGC